MKLLMVIDMQRDFVDSGGALYFPEAEKVIPHVVDKIREYITGGQPIVATRDWHAPDDREFDRFPRHCVAGSAGAELTRQVKDALSDYANLHILNKTRYSAFFNTNLDALLAEIRPKMTEVVGVATNICVLHTVEELRNRDMPVRVIASAVDSFDKEAHAFALKHMEEVLGAEVVR